jgi:Copper type II ascorbate-dependent monooxygenase, C-terminal domain
MPQAPLDPLTPEQIATLSAWANGGAPQGTDATCGAIAGSAGTGSIEGTAGTGMGAAGTGAMEGEECYDLLAHANGDKATPYAVPTTPDHYAVFNFAPPWGSGAAQVTRAVSSIQNPAIVHHWILYSGGGTDGSVTTGTGTHSGQFIVGWAPGAQDTEMPMDVGLELPAGNFQLEVHYNATTAGLTDMSGVKVCVTKSPRPNTAATHPLGHEWLSPTAGAGDVTGSCKPAGPFPITILTSSPHMHKKGTHMKTVINRANGTTEPLIDKSFDFNLQLAYDTPAVLNEGDTLTTTCTYNGSARFGTGTSDEMCYNFVTAYPAGALAGASGYTGLSNNGNTCIRTGF